MQSVSSRIWTRVAMSIYCDDNQYTTDMIVFIINHLFAHSLMFLSIAIYL